MRLEDLQVELREHTGLQQTRVGVVEVYLHQFEIMVNGHRVGFIGDEPGCIINFTDYTLPLSAQAVIKRKVDESLGRVSPPAANSAPIMEEDHTEPEEVSYGQEPRRTDAVRQPRVSRSRRRKIT
jgi:hypothetical protein